MPKDIKFIIGLFAMKYNTNITFIELENQGILDFSNMVSMPKYHCYIFAGDGRILSIQQETFELQETILQEYKYCIFYHQELTATPDKNGTVQVSSLPRKFKLLVNIPTSNLKLMSKKLKKDNSDGLIGGQQEEYLCLDADPTSAAAVLAKATAEKCKNLKKTPPAAGADPTLPASSLANENEREKNDEKK